MRTRRSSFPSPSDGITFLLRPPTPGPSAAKRPKLSRSPSPPSPPGFHSLTDDLLLAVMVSVGSSASRPADLINAMLTCKRFCAIGTHPKVLANVSVAGLSVNARSWSDGARNFLKQCAQAGNVDAGYILGMILFYCVQDRELGKSAMAQAAVSSQLFAPALHSLAIIHFNGSGGTRKDKNLRSAISLCARAASLLHVDAMRELGHCLQDGYGVPKNISEGRRLLLEANAREAAAAVDSSPQEFVETALQLAAAQTDGPISLSLRHHLHVRTAVAKFEAAANQPRSSRGRSRALSPEEQLIHRLFHTGGECSLLSDFGCNVPPAKLHAANEFLVDWFAENPPSCGLRLCSHANCGRPETRKHEFRRCSACGKVNYCSRACQALDWKQSHKQECSPAAGWQNRQEENDGEGEVDPVHAF